MLLIIWNNAMRRLPLIVSIFLLAACVSDFRQRENAFLRRESETSLAQKIVKGQTTRAEIEAMFGRPSRGYNGCYGYYTVSLPFYNFLPTNFFYMKSRDDTWKLCIDYAEDNTVADYRFSHDVKTDIDSPAGSAIQVLFKRSEKSTQSTKENP
ncbi:glucosamine-fructose-6-phosphate aminotransferase [Kingella potus]|nr:glucosamine-fructose-6-phosphate aminotransferase [Kingella potus]